METAKTFWQNAKEYPPFPHRFERRMCDLDYLVPKMAGVKSFLDLGCGDGWLIKCLHELTDIKTFHAYDFSENLLKHVTGAEKKVFDIYDPKPLPKVDVVYMGAVIQYIENKPLLHLLRQIKSPLIIKTPCAEVTKKVDSRSKELGTKYASIYRSLPDMYELLTNAGFKFQTPQRAYSDAIESKFGTKQIFFLCVKK